MHPVLQKISFTKSESRVIVFSILLILSGILISYFKAASAGNESSLYLSRAGNIQRPGQPNGNTNAETNTLISGNEETILDNEKAADSLETKSKKKSKKEDKLAGIQINLNTATKEQLIMLPGVGESTADKIMAYRQDHGGFKKPEDIMKIKGIGKKKFEKLKPYITTD